MREIPVNRGQTANERTKEISQGLQTLDPKLRRQSTRHERQDRAAGLAEPCDPADRACEDPTRQNATSVVHGDGVHRPEQHADE